ncbi:hypothetical protein [Nostoc sp.]
MKCGHGTSATKTATVINANSDAVGARSRFFENTAGIATSTLLLPTSTN